MKIIAHILTDFPTKFGIPRQSGLISDLTGTIIFEPEFRVNDAIRGLETFSHLWIIWKFSESERETWSPTVRPPRLGGNKRMGVFATRSPFRPNPIGLSSVKLDSIEYSSPSGPLIHVSGIDMMNNTPIYDIKPYNPNVDCHSDASAGYIDLIPEHKLNVDISEKLLSKVPEKLHKSLRDILINDPRPSYQDNPSRIYGFIFSKFEIKFTVSNNNLKVLNIISTP